jgi:transcription initiation factor TFIID subunit 1
MYRCPIFEHRVPDNDFVVIRCGVDYFVREADAIFVVGQQVPLVKVPTPNSKWQINFTPNLVKV